MSELSYTVNPFWLKSDAFFLKAPERIDQRFTMYGVKKAGNLSELFSSCLITLELAIECDIYQFI